MPQPLPTPALNVPQVFAQALQLHHPGRLREAEPLYAARPDHFDALQMMALVKLAAGHAVEALRGALQCGLGVAQARPLR
jgi:hypothetical protein